jgi:hypothetical protein
MHSAAGRGERGGKDLLYLACIICCFHDPLDGVWVYGVRSGYLVSHHGPYLTTFLFKSFF